MAVHTKPFLPRVGVPGRERLLFVEAFPLWFIFVRLELFCPCSARFSASRESRTSSKHTGEEEYDTDNPLFLQKRRSKFRG